jgi:hypothetical protein
VDGTVRVRRYQAYTWQLPVIFLTCSVLTMIIGMWVLIWTSAVLSRDGSSWWTGDAKVSNASYPVIRGLAIYFPPTYHIQSAVCFTILSTVTFVVFLSGQTTLYSPVIELEDEDI